MKRLIEEARRILRMGSVTENGNEELSNYVGVLMRAIGLTVQSQNILHSRERISKKQINILGILGDTLVDRKIRTGLLLATPLDTPNPGRMTAWTETNQDPFLAEVRGETLFGLGSASGKLDLLCKLYAVQEFRERKLKMPIYVVGLCGEDLHQMGAHFLVQSKALNPKFVLVGRPTGLKLVHRHPATQSFRIQLGYKVFPKGAHGFNRKILLKSIGRLASTSSASNGVHAIRRLFAFLEQASFSGFQMQFVKLVGGTYSEQIPDIADAELYLTSHQLEDFKRFFRDHGTDLQLTLGGMGDGGVTFLPDSLFEAMKDVDRLLAELNEDPSTGCQSHWTYLHQDNSRAELGVSLVYDQNQHPDEARQRWMQKLQDRLRPYTALNATIQKDKLCPALDMSPEQEWVRTCMDVARQSGLDSKSVATSSSPSSAGLFFASGFPALAFGPGNPIDNVGSPNEQVDLSDLERAIAFYTALIERVCL